MLIYLFSKFRDSDARHLPAAFPAYLGTGALHISPPADKCSRWEIFVHTSARDGLLQIGVSKTHGAL
jgi:hypothetical protein